MNLFPWPPRQGASGAQPNPSKEGGAPQRPSCWTTLPVAPTGAFSSFYPPIDFMGFDMPQNCTTSCLAKDFKATTPAIELFLCSWKAGKATHVDGHLWLLREFWEFVVLGFWGTNEYDLGPSLFCTVLLMGLNRCEAHRLLVTHVHNIFLEFMVLHSW